ncbi:MAG: hypothetical protein ABI867_16980 [Kofleriaceae bacterium]
MTTLDEVLGAGFAMLLDDVVKPATTAPVRAACAEQGYTRYGLLDRGSYEVIEWPPAPGLCDALADLAMQYTRRNDLAIVAARMLRFVPGDYLLAHHDPIAEDRPVELVLDLSTAALPGAEVHYRRRGGVVFRMPVVPGSLAIVERGPTVTCNHGYVSKLNVGAEVVRLVLLLR